MMQENIVKEINCRVCRAVLENKPRFTLNNVPATAQNFPDKKSLHLDKTITLNIYVCDICRTTQIINKPVSYYKSVIRAVAVSKEMISFRKKQFDNFIREFNLINKNIIEIGSGNGEYLQILDKLDVNAFGMEYELSSVKNCQKNGLNVSKGFPDELDDLSFDKKFDAFMIRSFLEHWPNPVELLKNLHKILAKNAVGIIEVPNFEMILEKGLFSEFMLDHLTYFNRQSFAYALTIAGFEVIEIKNIWHDYILSAKIRNISPISMLNMSVNRKFILDSMFEYVAKNHRTGIAIWGAGHQSLALLSMLKNKELIECVIDSAKFKQDRYTPGSHIPVRSPKYLQNRTISSILVIGGSYNQEIVKIIKKEYSFIGNIAYLDQTRLVKL